MQVCIELAGRRDGYYGGMICLGMIPINQDVLVLIIIRTVRLHATSGLPDRGDHFQTTMPLAS